MNFWRELNNPISCLAPMYDVTDVVFRQIIAQTAKPNVMFTEFVNTDAFISAGRAKIESKLWTTPEQTPVIAQIWGINPESYFKTAQELAQMGFAGIDINMGCPQKSEMKIGACAALIANPNLAKEIVAATKQGAGDLPVSVKTRIGLKKVNTEEWIGFLLAQDVATLTIHARTAAQMSDVSADWSQIAKAVELKNIINPKTIIIGNGDVKDCAHGESLCAETGANGYMIGRGIFENPWAFVMPVSQIENRREKLLQLAIKHLELYRETYSGERNYNITKRFFKIYARDFEGAGDLRAKLMDTNSEDEAIKLIKDNV